MTFQHLMKTTGSKSLQKLELQQAQESEEMQSTVAGAQLMITSQGKQMIVLQCCIVSTQMQLDNILRELNQMNQVLESSQNLRRRSC